MSLDLLLLLQAALIGLSIAAPVGPIALLIIQRTLTQGFAFGAASGLGAALADALYGAAAGFGFVAASDQLASISQWLSLAGALFLAVLGLKALAARPAEGAAQTKMAGGRLFMAFASTLVLTLTNPMTILAFLAVFASLGVAAGEGSDGAAATVVLGVFLGSLFWQIGLAFAASLGRRFVTERRMLWINRSSGLLLLAFAGWLLWRLGPA